MNVYVCVYSTSKVSLYSRLRTAVEKQYNWKASSKNIAATELFIGRMKQITIC